MKKILFNKLLSLFLTFLMIFTLFPSHSFANTTGNNVIIDQTNFSDDTFREYVKKFDSDNNNYLSNNEINKIKTIDFQSEDYNIRNNIKSLKGIEFFYNLDKLIANNMHISSLDLSKNTKITSLSVNNCLLFNLNVKNCNNLQFLNCTDNKLRFLNLSDNTQLIDLNCNDNLLYQLDLSKNSNLQSLNCSNNKLVSLNLFSNVFMFKCDNNQRQISNGTPISNLQEFDPSKIINRESFNKYLVNNKINFNGDSEITYSYNTGVNSVIFKLINHEHNAEPRGGNKPTLTKPGCKEYYYCGGCDSYFEDKACTKEILDIDSWSYLPSLENHVHNPKFFKGKPATQTEEGIKDYYYCEGCATYYEDQKCTKPIKNLIEWKVIPKLSSSCEHKMRKYSGTPPTCTNIGLKDYYYCLKCSKYFADSEGLEEITKEQRTDPNWKNIDKIPHKAIKISKIEPTAATFGKEEHFQCSMCKAYFEDEACTRRINNIDSWGNIPKLKHQLETFIGTPATCIKDGTKTYYHCKTCNKYFEDKECIHEINDINTWKVIKKTGHNVIKTEKVNPTCTKNGSKAYYHCKTCNKYFEDKECIHEINDINTWKIIKKTGHNVIKTEKVNPTCTLNGKEAYYHCTNCKKYYTNSQCNNEILDISNWGILRPTGHNIETILGKPATCTHTGLKDYYHCDKCSKYFADSEGLEEITKDQIDDPNWKNIDKIPHKAIKILKVEPTATSFGKKEHFQCSMCKSFFEDEACTRRINNIDSWGNIPKLKHQLETFNGTPATCIKDGTKTYYHCKTCNKYFEDKECMHEINDINTWKVIKKTGHNVIKTDQVNATCTKDGSKAYYHCKTCNKYFEDKECIHEINDINTWKIIKKTGHNVIKTDRVNATCTKDGSKAYYHCKTCNKYFEDKECIHEINDINTWKIIKKTGHNVIKTDQVNPTCTLNGKRAYYQCANCKKYYSDSQCNNEILDISNWGILRPTGHNIEVIWGKPATCTHTGLKDYYHCEQCGENYEDKNCTKKINGLLDDWRILPLQKHDIITVNGKEPTCTESGLRPYYYCKNCSKNFEDESCTTEILENIQKWTYIHANGHKLVFHKGKEPSYTETGLKPYYHCSECNINFEDESCKLPIKENIDQWRIIEKKSHTLTYVSGKEATCTEDGLRPYYLCEKCGKCFSDDKGFSEITVPLEKWRVINKLTHKITYVPGKESSYTESGLKPYYYCNNCKKYYEDSNCLIPITKNIEEWRFIPIKKHSPKLIQGKEPSYTETGLKPYYHCSECNKNFEDQACTIEIIEDINKWRIIPVILHKHKLEIFPRIEPTITSEGSKKYFYCSICKQYFKDKNGKNKITQDINEWKRIPCKQHKHTITHFPKIDSTYTETGLKEYFHCTECNKNFEDSKCLNEIEEDINSWRIIPIIEHVHNPIYHKSIPATCLKNGAKGYYECELCHKYFENESCTTLIEDNIDNWKLINKKEHKLNSVPEIPSTCTQEGSKAYYYCNQCNSAYEDFDCIKRIDNVDVWKVLPKKSHTAILIQGQEPTYQENGLKPYYHCIECNKNFEDVACTIEITENINTWRIIDKLSHDLVYVRGIPATCLEEGSSEYYHCKKCNKNFEDSNALKEISEDILKWKTIPKKRHLIEPIQGKAPTTTSNGYKTYYHCNTCSKNFEDEECKIEIKSNIEEWRYIEKLNHQHVLQPLNYESPTCLKSGLKKCFYCESCKKYFTDETCNTEITDDINTWRYIKPLEHSVTFKEGIPPTCTNPGSKSCYYCETCEKYFTDETCNTEITDDINTWRLLPKVPHTLIYYPSIAPTYQNNGQKSYYYCKVCKKYYSDRACNYVITDDIAIWKVIPKLIPENITIPDSTSQPELPNNQSLNNNNTETSVKIDQKIKSKNNTYKVISTKSKTVSFYNEKKNSKTVIIPTSIKIDNKSYKVTSISSNAFKNNKKIKKIIIDKNIKSIGKYAFSGCKNLKYIYIKSNSIKKIDKNAFKGIHKKAIIKVPKKSYKKYKKLFKNKGLSKYVKVIKY